MSVAVDLPALGVHEGMSEIEYRAAPGINKSGLDLIHRSPAHYLHATRHPRPATPAMTLGRALHCLVLEPERFSQCFVADPHPGSYSKAAKEAREQLLADGVEIVPARANDEAGVYGLSAWDAIHRMRDALMAHPIAASLLTAGGRNELSLWWRAPRTDVLCKGRIDRHDEAHSVLIDLKSTSDASYSEFCRSVHNYRYHVQAAYYTDGAQACGLAVDAFAFVCAEKEPPYAVACYVLQPEWLDLARVQYQQDLARYHACYEAAAWPSYAPEIRELELPRYARLAAIS